jgi:hypothetical protein
VAMGWGGGGGCDLGSDGLNRDPGEGGGGFSSCVRWQSSRVEGHTDNHHTLL